MKQILVTGSEGQVGSEIIRHAEGKDIGLVATTKNNLDITQLSNIEDIINKYKPGIIINAAAYTAVDKAEKEIDTAFLVNRDGAANLAQACKNAGIPLLHISTDYVFDGKKEESYKETDKPDPISVYGKSKLEGEEAIQKILLQHIIIRTSWIFSSSGKNFPKTMLRLANERDTLDIVDDQFGAPTWAGDIAGVLLDIAYNYIQGQRMNWGVYHYTGSPVTNWYKFAKIIFEQAKENGMLKNIPILNAISSTAYPTAAKRPVNSVLNCQKMHEELNVAQPDWHVGLDIVLKQWKMQ
jgi:dTDP-4-dehydrorhamnose reductase